MQNRPPQNTTALQTNKPYVAEIQKAYGDAINFLTVFNCGQQYNYVKNHFDKCFKGSAPSINRSIEAYGEAVLKDWLNLQLIDLALFCGVKADTVTPEQIQAATEAIIINYGYLKLTEFMVFFQWFKGGRYGRFWGSFDSMLVTAGLKEFIEHRRLVLTKLDAQRG